MVSRRALQRELLRVLLLWLIAAAIAYALFRWTGVLYALGIGVGALLLAAWWYIWGGRYEHAEWGAIDRRRQARVRRQRDRRPRRPLEARGAGEESQDG